MKRKYISPMLVVEETEPWELMAGTQIVPVGPIAPGEGTDDDPWPQQTSKQNSFFVPYSNDFEDTTE